MGESNSCPDCGVLLADSKRYCASCGQEVRRAAESNPMGPVTDFGPCLDLGRPFRYVAFACESSAEVAAAVALAAPLARLTQMAPQVTA